MHSTSAAIGLLIITLFFGTSNAQCVTSNEINVNETNVGSTVRTVMDGSLNFGLHLFRTLQLDERGDFESTGIFFSPFSVWSALIVAYMGSKGRTEMELQNVLGLGSANKEAVWGAYNNLRNWNTYRQSDQESYTLANKLYFETGTPVKDCLKDMIDSDIDFADFSGDPDGSVNTINQWVEQQTRNRIKDLIPPGSITAMTHAVIANAVYFKEEWLTQFDREKTRRRRFTLPNRKDIYVNMMGVKGQFLYGISEELQCSGVELQYKGNDLSMIILLPNNRYYGISVLANRLTPEHLQDFLSEMYPREVLLSVPRFKIEDSFELSDVLDKMGLKTLFNPQEVDLSEFTGSKDVTVDAVYHKAFIDVNEEGTEAAAATAVITSRTARPLGPAAFTADYSFLFLIRDNAANVILFMGAVKKPPEFGTE